MSNPQGHKLISAHEIAVVYQRGRTIFRRDSFTALEDVSLDIFAGESLGVIGRNGVGKTTLLRVLAGIIKPDRGTIENFGATTAMLSMQAGFDQYASGRTNIMLSALLLGYTIEEILNRTDDIIEYSELGEFIDQPLIGYSAGMRARLGFSICYFLEPDVLLIDEALGAGDAAFRQKSSKAMREKIGSDQTVVLVSHEVNTIRNLCTRVIWIEDGKTVMEGEVSGVIREYQKSISSLSPHLHKHGRNTTAVQVSSLWSVT